MLAKRLLESFRNELDQLWQEQAETIERAAELVFTSVSSGGAWHVFDTGHIIDRELIHRSGGLMMIRRFSWDFSVDNPVPGCLRDRPPSAADFDVELASVRLAVQASQVRSGDVMTIGSVSGKSCSVVELALECRRLGCSVVAISSRAFSSRVESDHPSGKRLFEVADVFLDNRAPFGDAHLAVDGLEEKVFPLSGITSTTLMWMICAGVIEELVAQGSPPKVWKSVNIPGNRERNERVATGIVDERGF